MFWQLAFSHTLTHHWYINEMVRVLAIYASFVRSTWLSVVIRMNDTIFPNPYGPLSKKVFDNGNVRCLTFVNRFISIWYHILAVSC